MLLRGIKARGGTAIMTHDDDQTTTTVVMAPGAEHWISRWAPAIAVVITLMSLGGAYVSKSAADDTRLASLERRVDSHKADIMANRSDISQVHSDISGLRREADDTNSIVHQILDDMIQKGHHLSLRRGLSHDARL